MIIHDGELPVQNQREEIDENVVGNNKEETVSTEESNDNEQNDVDARGELGDEDLQFDFGHFQAAEHEQQEVNEENSDVSEDGPVDEERVEDVADDEQSENEQEHPRRSQRQRLPTIILSYDEMGDPSYAYR